MFKVTSDPIRKLVIAEMEGFLTVDEVKAFSEEEQRLVRDMGCTSGGFVLLVNTEHAVIQSQGWSVR